MKRNREDPESGSWLLTVRSSAQNSTPRREELGFPPTPKKLRNRSPLPNSKRLDLVWEGGAASSRQTGPGGTPAGRGGRPRHASLQLKLLPGKRRRGVGPHKPRRGACWPASVAVGSVETRGCLWQESLAGPTAGVFPGALPACLLEIWPGKAACSPGQVRSRRCCCSRCCCRCHSRPGLPPAPWPLSEEPAVGGVAGDLPHLHATCARPPSPAV